MQIRNNMNNIDEKLIQDFFPNAYIVSKPEIIEFNDPSNDVLFAEITDWYGRKSLRSVRLIDTNTTNHWPGEFGFDGDEDTCTTPCYWIAYNWRPACIGCQFV